MGCTNVKQTISPNKIEYEQIEPYNEYGDENESDHELVKPISDHLTKMGLGKLGRKLGQEDLPQAEVTDEITEAQKLKEMLELEPERK